MPPATIIGIDPGTATTGYGIVRAEGSHCAVVTYGTIRTPSDRSRAERLRMIHDALDRLILDHSPDIMAVEQLFFSRNVKTAMAVGEARGVVLLTAACRSVPVFEYTPTAVKQSLSGYGRAGKHDIQQMVAWALDLAELPRPDDAADALAVALCHLFQTRLEGVPS